MTYEFAQQVLKLSDDTTQLKTAAECGGDPKAGESMSNVLDIVHDHPHAIPNSLVHGLQRWSGGSAMSSEDNGHLIDGLGSLGTTLRQSIERACFETVTPQDDG
jgi:hypothetical protein